MNLVLICLVGSIYLFSYLVIFEGYYTESETKQGVILINEVNSYIIDNGDGTYDLYLADVKIETLDSLEHYNEDVPVYTKEELEYAQQENP